MHIVCFNGPPRSGKDTLANLLAEVIESESASPPPIFPVSLSTPLRHIAYSMVGRRYDDSTYEAFKNEYFERLDRTGRQLMIDASESFLKPTYGQAVMADLLIQQLRAFPSNALVLVRDSGFQVEVDPLIAEVGVSNLMVVQVHRTGCNFDNDSREFVFHPDHRQGAVWNNGGIPELRQEAQRLYLRLMSQYRWAV